MPSDTDCEDGSDITARGLAGLKSPGDEIGVLLAVREGGCRVLMCVGMQLETASEEGCGSMVLSWS